MLSSQHCVASSQFWRLLCFTQWPENHRPFFAYVCLQRNSAVVKRTAKDITQSFETWYKKGKGLGETTMGITSHKCMWLSLQPYSKCPPALSAGPGQATKHPNPIKEKLELVHWNVTASVKCITPDTSLNNSLRRGHLRDVLAYMSHLPHLLV